MLATLGFIYFAQVFAVLFSSFLSNNEAVEYSKTKAKTQCSFVSLSWKMMLRRNCVLPVTGKVLTGTGQVMELRNIEHEVSGDTGEGMGDNAEVMGDTEESMGESEKVSKDGRHRAY